VRDKSKQHPRQGKSNIPLSRFEHDGARVWWGEFFGHDVTIARIDGETQFKIWIDAKLITDTNTYQEAQNLAVKRCALT
jgi:hypothetical protein